MMAAPKRAAIVSKNARGSNKNGTPGEQLPGSGTPKKFFAVLGHPIWRAPDVLYTANEVLTPWNTQLEEAASAWSGGWQPDGGHIEDESAIPLNLTVVVAV